MKLKNRGFAITALLYGLSIMALMTVVLLMSIMQNSRKNNTTVVKDVEQELNSYGETAANYSSGGSTESNLKFIVPEGQDGYYKIQLFGGGIYGSMVSGTIYLESNTSLTINLPTNGTATIVSPDNDIIMKAGKTTTDNFINGMAKWADQIKGNGKYHFLNGQEFLKVNNKAESTARINKVSKELPAFVNNKLDKVGCIQADSNSNITLEAVTYNEKNSSVKGYKSTNGKLPIGSSSNVSLSDIYIAISGEKVKPKITLYENNTCSGTSYTLPGSGYTFLSGTEINISKYSPIEKDISLGNYSISLLTKDANNKHKTESANTLTTSAFTPTSNPWEHHYSELILYGNTSIGRPVITKDYTGGNNQMWRIEPGDSGYKRVSEIEEYKPFAINTGSQDTATGEGGPVLICGVYQWIGGKFTAHDNEMNSNTENKQWEFVPAGLGLYILRANKMTRYLSCKGSGNNNRCYLTAETTDASLFKVFNANL